MSFFTSPFFTKECQKTELHIKMERIVNALHKYPISLDQAAEILEIMGVIAERMEASKSIEWLRSKKEELEKDLQYEGK